MPGADTLSLITSYRLYLSGEVAVKPSTEHSLIWKQIEDVNHCKHLWGGLVSREPPSGLIVWVQCRSEADLWSEGDIYMLTQTRRVVSSLISALMCSAEVRRIPARRDTWENIQVRIRGKERVGVKCSAMSCHNSLSVHWCGLFKTCLEGRRCIFMMETASQRTILWRTKLFIQVFIWLCHMLNQCRTLGPLLCFRSTTCALGDYSSQTTHGFNGVSQEDGDIRSGLSWSDLSNMLNDSQEMCLF